MFKLNIKDIMLLESAIVIAVKPFITEFEHHAWASEFLKKQVLSNYESEVSADYSQHSFTFNSHIFILNINDLSESIWINDTSQHNAHIASLYRHLKGQVVE